MAESNGGTSLPSTNDRYLEITRVRCQLWRSDASDRTWLSRCLGALASRGGLLNQAMLLGQACLLPPPEVLVYLLADLMPRRNSCRVPEMGPAESQIFSV